MTQREDKQRARTSREELGKFFYNLAAVTFGTTVLGSGMGVNNREWKSAMAFQYVSARSSAYNFFCLLRICDN